MILAVVLMSLPPDTDLRVVKNSIVVKGGCIRSSIVRKDIE